MLVAEERKRPSLMAPSLTYARCAPPSATYSLGSPAVLAEAVRPVTLRPKLPLGLPFSSQINYVTRECWYSDSRTTYCEPKLTPPTTDVKGQTRVENNARPSCIFRQAPYDRCELRQVRLARSPAAPREWTALNGRWCL